MQVREASGSDLIWNSYDDQGENWFSATIDLLEFEAVKTTDNRTSDYIIKILKACIQNNSEFLSKWKKYHVKHYLEFPRKWGLGSSSSLIYNLAEWSDNNPYFVYFDVENGSGYDIACAGADGPILYTKSDESLQISDVDFNPAYKDRIFFLPLGKKVRSTEEVEKFKKRKIKPSKIEHISKLSHDLVQLKSLPQFEKWIEEHEVTTSQILGRPTIKEERFSDFPGQIKSLGAWGGDLVLITAPNGLKEATAYFEKKELTGLIPFDHIVL